MSKDTRNSYPFHTILLILVTIGLGIGVVCGIAMNFSKNSVAVTNEQPTTHPHDYISPDEYCWALGHDWSLGKRIIFGDVEEWFCLDDSRHVVTITLRKDGSEKPWVRVRNAPGQPNRFDYVWVNRNYFSRFLEYNEEIENTCPEGSTMEAIIPKIDGPLKDSRTGRLIRDGWVLCQEGTDLVMRDGGHYQHPEKDRWENVISVPDQLRKTGFEHEAHFGIEY
jgi:hypothetical protein